jgi:hypothetical protein
MNYFTIKSPLFFEYFKDELTYLKFYQNDASEISDWWYVVTRRQQVLSHPAMLLGLF